MSMCSRALPQVHGAPGATPASCWFYTVTAQSRTIWQVQRESAGHPRMGTARGVELPLERLPCWGLRCCSQRHDASALDSRRPQQFRRRSLVLLTFVFCLCPQWEGKRQKNFRAFSFSLFSLAPSPLSQDGVFLDFVLDDAPLKQNTYCPGTRIPVRPTSSLKHLNDRPVVARSESGAPLPKCAHPT